MKKQITAYRLGGKQFKIRPAPHTREWMDRTNQKYAYRCLPLVAANCYGWELLCPDDVTAVWNGGDLLEDIEFKPKVSWLVSHFGYGIITFHIPYLFRTGKEADLLVSGPTNRYKHGALPLEGIVETSWSPMTFTMNWQLGRNTVSFQKDEPICRIVPVARKFLDKYEAKIIEYQDIPHDIATAYREWSDRRRVFNEQLAANNPEFVKAGWQRNYFKQAKVTKLPEFKPQPLCSLPS